MGFSRLSKTTKTAVSILLFSFYAAASTISMVASSPLPKVNTGLSCNYDSECAHDRTGLLCSRTNGCFCKSSTRLGKYSMILTTAFDLELEKCVTMPGTICFTNSGYLQCSPKFECRQIHDDPGFGVCTLTSSSSALLICTTALILCSILSIYSTYSLQIELQYFIWGFCNKRLFILFLFYISVKLKSLAII